MYIRVLFASCQCAGTTLYVYTQWIFRDILGTRTLPIVEKLLLFGAYKHVSK